MSKGFKNTDKFQQACRCIIHHDRADQPTKDFIQGVANTCNRTGYVSKKQAKCVGGSYMRIVNNGIYIKHDWWT